MGSVNKSGSAIPETIGEVPEGHPQARSHLAQFDTVGFRAIFA